MKRTLLGAALAAALLAAGTPAAPATATGPAPAGTALADSWQPPLRTQGR